MMMIDFEKLPFLMKKIVQKHIFGNKIRNKEKWMRIASYIEITDLYTG